MLQPPPSKTAFKTMLAAWLLAGTLDIGSALVLFSVRTGKSPLIIFRYISSALFGREIAYAGGPGMIITGLILHYLIAFIFTVVLFLFYPRIYGFIKNRIVIGILYGLFVWTVMNVLVVPFTRIPFHGYTLSNSIENIVILMLAIGLPVALIAHYYYYGNNNKPAL